MNRKNKFTQSVTALYCRLSIEDGRENESMSIQNQENICQGEFYQKGEIPLSILNRLKYVQILFQIE